MDNNMPIRQSTALRRVCASMPEKEVAAIWLAPVATATGAGTPSRISEGVMMKPPPTPTRPDTKPMAPLTKRTSTTFTGISAIGK